MTNEEFNEISRKLAAKRELIAKLESVVIGHFEVLKTPQQEICNFKIQKLPYGVIGIKEVIPIKDDLFNRNEERFFWLDFTGKKSNFFNKMWDVYYDCQYNYPDYHLHLTAEELEILGLRYNG